MKDNLNPKTFGLIAVVVIAIGALLWQVFGSVGAGMETQRNIDINDYISKMARESGGDINKLSAEDQKRVQEITKGDGTKVLSMHPAARMGPPTGGTQ